MFNLLKPGHNYQLLPNLSKLLEYTNYGANNFLCWHCYNSVHIQKLHQPLRRSRCLQLPQGGIFNLIILICLSQIRNPMYNSAGCALIKTLDILSLKLFAFQIRCRSMSEMFLSRFICFRLDLRLYEAATIEHRPQQTTICWC